MKTAMVAAFATAPAPKPAPTVHGARKERLEYLDVGEIDVVKNVRTQMSPARLEELAASIQANGVIQPLIVRVVAGRYKLVAGERRLRAARMAGLEVVPCVVRELGDARALEAQLVENTHREKMDAVDEAFGVRELHEKIGLTQEVTAQRLGKSPFYVSQQLALTELPRRALDALRRGVINRAGAYEIAKLERADDRAAVIAAVLPEGGAKKWEGRHVAAAQIRSAVRALRAKGGTRSKARLRTPTAETRAEVVRHWRYFLLGFSLEEFALFVKVCEGSYDAGVMAEAAAAVVGERLGKRKW